MKDLDSQMDRLPMTLLMASSFITYLGIMPEDTRLQMTSLWCQNLKLPDFRFMTMMSTETGQILKSLLKFSKVCLPLNLL